MTTKKGRPSKKCLAGSRRSVSLSSDLIDEIAEMTDRARDLGMKEYRSLSCILRETYFKARRGVKLELYQEAKRQEKAARIIADRVHSEKVQKGVINRPEKKNV